MFYKEKAKKIDEEDDVIEVDDDEPVVDDSDFEKNSNQRNVKKDR